MPKLKSHSGAKKRIRKTGSGRLAFKRNSRGHLLQQKSKRQKRLNRTKMMSPRDERNISLLLPNI
ncbi:MAG: 50S ribosomal protein L35 [Candidatus Peribacteraceae bacterium]|nr:50S ribosomal protein L35 [Candidatus Peribacteraceae bacterium]